jgi:peptidyl-prolyl cis-trans isomerase C
MTHLPKFRGPAVILALAAVVALSVHVRSPSAQQAIGDAVVATVDGEPITEKDLAAAADEIGDQVSQMQGDPRTNLINIIINFRLAARAGEAAHLDQDPQVAAHLALVRDRALYLEYMRGQISGALSEEAARKRFDEEAAKFVAGDEIHAAHILVKTEDEAEAIIADLDNGADFAEVAKAKSMDASSASNGGDLDFIRRGDIPDKAVEDAAFALNAGEYSKVPVQSPFGWHVINVTERRPAPPPTFEEEARRIQEDLFGESFDAAINALRAAAKIEIIPDAPAGVTPEPAPPAAGGAPAAPGAPEAPAPEPYPQ